MTPTTGQEHTGGTVVAPTIGYLVTFACSTAITGIEFQYVANTGSAITQVWDANGNVLATGSTVVGGTLQWYHSNITFEAVAGEQYIVGVHASENAYGNAWDNITLPFTVDGITVTQACVGTLVYGDASAPDLAPTCGSSEGYDIRVVTQ